MPRKNDYNSAALLEVLKSYDFPFDLRDDQAEDVEYLCRYCRVGVFLDVGLGKTAVSTAVCFYHGLQGTVENVLCLVPPVLIPQWAEWLRGFEGITVTEYRGTKAKRQDLSLDADFVITTLGLFKNDYERFMGFYRDKKTMLIVDEAESIRMPGTGNYMVVQDFMGTPDKKLQMLTATPLGAHPATAYGYIKLKTPDTYRDFAQFTLLHVGGTDMRGNPNSFKNLDLLRSALMEQAVYRKAEDVLTLPEIQYIPIRYELESKHRRMYDELIDELLLELENGVVIDATTTQRMYSAAQQFILNVPDGGKTKPAGFDVLDQVIEETGLLRLENEKLLVYTNFRNSNDGVMEHLAHRKVGAVQVYGGSDSQKALEQFKNDPSIKVMVANPKSGGVGLNLQFVRYILCLETPETSGRFQQVIGRIKRAGQTRKQMVWMASAIGTIQETINRNVVKKEDVLVKVTPTKETLRAALKGSG